MTQRSSGKVRAGARPIGAFERGRWRLRRTRHLLNRLCGFGDWWFEAGAVAECAGSLSLGPVQKDGNRETCFFGDRVHQELLAVCGHHVWLPGIRLQRATHVRGEERGRRA